MNTKLKQGGTPAKRNRAGWLRSAAVAAIGLALLSGCGPSEQTLTIGDQAARYNKELWNLSLWAIGISVIIFIGVSIFLFTTVNRFREENNKDEPLQEMHGNNSLEVVLIGFPILIVLALSLLSVRTMVHTNSIQKGDQQPNITALAKQFWWGFTYTDETADAGGNVSNGNELVIPAGVDAVMTLESGDVVHEFWAPNVGPQRQAIPGSKKVWAIHTDRPAIYQGNCNYLCGASHANMRYKVVALPPNDYAAFIKAAREYKAPEPEAGSIEAQGRDLFMKGKPETGAVACAACHRIQGTEASSPVGPDLSFFGTRRTLGAGMWEAQTEEHWDEPGADEHLVNWIHSSPTVKPGSLMPAYDGKEHMLNGEKQKSGELTLDEVKAIAAYLKTLKLPEEADYWSKVDKFNAEHILPGGKQ